MYFYLPSSTFFHLFIWLSFIYPGGRSRFQPVYLPPFAIAWKTFLIPSYSEVYSSFLVCFPFKKHFHIPACLFENALLFSGSPLLFASWDILCPRPTHSLSAIPFLPPSWIDGVCPLPCPPAFPSAGAFPQAWSVRSIRCLDAAFTRVPPVTLNAGSIYQPG